MTLQEDCKDDFYMYSNSCICIKQRGVHLIVGCSRAAPYLLNDADTLQVTLENGLKEAGATLLHIESRRFSRIG